MSHDKATPATFAEAFAGALARRGVTLSWLRDRLADRGYRVSLATLSYWRSGSRVPARVESLEALEEIEALLDVRDASLQSLARDRRRSVPAPRPFDELALGRAQAEVYGEGDVARVSFHLHVDVDRRAQRITSTATQLYLAQRDGVSGVTMFVGPDADGESNSSTLRAVHGCLIEPLPPRADGIHAVRLVFERPCRVGESVLVQVEVADEGEFTLDETEYGLVAEQRLEDCLVWVRFAPDDVPQRCWAYYEEGDVTEEWELELDGRTSAFHRQTAFGPGTVMIRWEW